MKNDLRILHHPVLGDEENTKDITIFFDGTPIPAKEGEPVAAALIAAGVKSFRETPGRHEKRGIFCAIGRCTDCMMIVNGQPNVRTCITPASDGMKVQTQYGFGSKPNVSGSEESR